MQVPQAVIREVVTDADVARYDTFAMRRQDPFLIPKAFSPSISLERPIALFLLTRSLDPLEHRHLDATFMLGFCELLLWMSTSSKSQITP